MTQEYLILDTGGIMTPEKYERHLNTINHYNRLAHRLPRYKQGTKEYDLALNKLKHLQEYIEKDQKEARKTADRILNKEN